MKCDFSFRHYREILEAAKSKGYFFTTLKDFDKNKDKRSLLILRHDIDFAPISALKIAEIEASLDIKSTFFVRLHAKQYNPFNFRIYSVLKKIAWLGHEIGLHSEVMDFAAIANEDAIESFDKEKKVFKALFGETKFGVSSHKDFTNTNNLDFWRRKNYRDPDVLYEAYDAKFLDNSKYISDSLGRWDTNKCVCRYINERYNSIYLLTHPVYWYNQNYHLEE